MKNLFAKTFRGIGLLRFDLLVKRQPTLPERVPSDQGQLVLIESSEVKKWACISCPGGCGETISLSLNPNQRPRWTVLVDFWQRPTIYPSVHQKNECGCHFWIKKGQVHWCEGGQPRMVLNKKSKTK